MMAPMAGEGTRLVALARPTPVATGRRTAAQPIAPNVSSAKL